MSFNGGNKFDYDRYLKHKEYFNNGLIELLEKYQSDKKKYKQQEEIYKATIYRLRATIKTLRERIKSYKNKDHFDKKHFSDYQNLLEEVEKLREENKSMKKELEFFRLNQPKQKDNTNSNIPSSFIMFKANVNTRSVTGKKRGGQIGHPCHKSELFKPDKILTKYVKSAPTGAVETIDERGNTYFAIQEIDMSFKTTVIETRYYLSDGGKSLSTHIMNKYKINPVIYSKRTKDNVLYLYSKGIIAFDRLSKMINVLSNGKITVKPSTIVNWVSEYSEEHEYERRRLLNQLLDSPILGVDETGYRINGHTAWVHVITDGEKMYYQMTDKRSDFLDVIKSYKGTLVHDHFKPYYKIDCTHAECNAHILRYLQAGVDFYENMACARMINFLQSALHEKHELLEQNIHKMPNDRIKYYDDEYSNIIDTELIRFQSENPKIKKRYVPEYIKTFQRMKEYKSEHLLFIHNFDVPFSNNDAERNLRIIKTRKKVSGQCFSAEKGNVMLTFLDNN